MLSPRPEIPPRWITWCAFTFRGEGATSRTGSGTPTAAEVSGVIKWVFFKVTPEGYRPRRNGVAYPSPTPRLLCGKDKQTLRGLEHCVCKVRLIPEDAQAYGSPGTHLYQYFSSRTIISKLKLLLPHGPNGPDTKKSSTPASRARAPEQLTEGAARPLHFLSAKGMYGVGGIDSFIPQRPR
jgi:hypothetical protein